MADRITLTVPARSDFAKTVRMTASSLVSRMGMNFDQVDDVRMAADEAFVYAIDTMSDGGDVHFEFAVDESGFNLAVRLGTCAGVSDDETERRTSYAAFILDSVCDSYDLTSDEAGVRWLRLSKRLESVDAD